MANDLFHNRQRTSTKSGIKSEGNLAVDTATGQMCKTWDWYCTKPTYYNPYTKKTEDNVSYGISCSAVATMPTCKSISDQR
jgi:hypothetical protein